MLFLLSSRKAGFSFRGFNTTLRTVSGLLLSRNFILHKSQAINIHLFAAVMVLEKFARLKAAELANFTIGSPRCFGSEEGEAEITRERTENELS